MLHHYLPHGVHWPFLGLAVATLLFLWNNPWTGHAGDLFLIVLMVFFIWLGVR